MLIENGGIYSDIIAKIIIILCYILTYIISMEYKLLYYKKILKENVPV